MSVDRLSCLILQIDSEDRLTPVDVVERLEGRITSGAPDLVLLPELWNAAFERRRIAQGTVRREEDFLAPFREWSTAYPGCLLAPGSAPLLAASAGTESRRLNRGWLIQGGELLARYDKLHLFGLMNEQDWILPGREPCVTTARFPGGELGVGLALCYDLRFPEHIRDLALRGAELLLLPSQWPRIRHFAFHHLLQARAIENGVCAVGANRGGSSGRTVFGGGSAAYGPGDAQVFLEPCYGEPAVFFEIDLAAARREREHLDALNDMRYRLLPPD